MTAVMIKNFADSCFVAAGRKYFSLIAIYFFFLEIITKPLYFYYTKVINRHDFINISGLANAPFHDPIKRR